MYGRAVFMMPEGERPHPRRPYRGRMYLQDTANESAICENVVVVIIPLAGRARERGALED
jgi:hypothetical protein